MTAPLDGERLHRSGEVALTQTVPPSYGSQPMALTRVQLDAWRSFLRAYDHAMRVLDAELRERHELTIGEYDVLVQLSLAAGRRLRMRDLARATLFSPSGVTRVCERMEQSGLVVREASPGDARGTDAVLTERGRAVLRAAAKTHRQGIHDHFARHFDEAQLAEFAAGAARVAAAARDVRPGP